MKSRINYQMSKTERAAMNQEINRQIAIVGEKYASEVDAIVLYALYKHFGFGRKRLRQFWECFSPLYQELVEHYEMQDGSVFLANHELKKIGVDVEEWNREV